MKRQVIMIDGGSTYDTYEDYLAGLKSRQIEFQKFLAGRKKWKDHLQDNLGEHFAVILPVMPNKMNAKYLEWKIWFEKFISFFDPEVLLVGHSLGGTFLVKYFSENKFPKKVLATFLVAPVFDTEGMNDSLGDFILSKDLSQFEAQAGKIFIYYSEDDAVVPFAQLKKFQSAFKTATARTFKDRGHFNQEQFPEIVVDIKRI